MKRNPKQDCLLFALLLVVSALVSPAVAGPPRLPDAGEDPVRDPLRLEKRTVVDIRDGTAYTLAVFAAPRDEAVVWTKPADLSMTDDNVGQVMFGGRQFCLTTTFDGAKYRIAGSSSNADLKSLITIDGREEVVWKNFMTWLPAPRTSNVPRPPRNWSMGLPDNTTDEILARLLARKPDVTWLNLCHTQVTEGGLRHLHGLPALKSVSLNDAQATDAGLQQLMHVTTLEALDLREAPVTDAGLKHLAGLTNLKRLVLDHTKISDAGLSHLAGLTALEDLGLANTPVTDAGLAHLRGLAGLKELRLGGTDVTDQGLASLRHLTNLELLILNRTLVTGPGLEHLRGMTKLKSLFLAATQVQDGDLKHLRESAGLKYLDLRFTPVTEDAARELRAMLPNNCHVATESFNPRDSSGVISMSYGLDGRCGTTGEIQQGIWKLYARSRSTGTIALYDLSHDLLERRNVASDHPDVVARLLDELRKFVASRGDTSEARRRWLDQHGGE